MGLSGVSEPPWLTWCPSWLICPASRPSCPWDPPSSPGLWGRGREQPRPQLPVQGFKTYGKGRQYPDSRDRATIFLNPWLMMRGMVASMG
jgi:hypothetical protein